MNAMTLTGSALAQANRWRESYNPLRGLTLSRAVTLIEGFQRGWMSDLQWAYFFIEQADPDLFALIERRTSALGEMEWEIKQRDAKKVAGFDQKLADDQVAALRDLYDGIDNLYEAIEHLAMATFRGFAHLERHTNADGDVTHLEICDQWNVAREGLVGRWKYNPEALPTTFELLPDENIIDPASWIIRDQRRHVNRIGLIKFIRQNLTQKDWDAFVEIYGLPSLIITAPPNLPPDKQQEFADAAVAIAEGGSGMLPNGSTATYGTGPRANIPFKEHLDYLSEKLILVGTGGLLTMLTQSGSGTLAGHAHKETFDSIAANEARKISALFNSQLEAGFLAARFPGHPLLAYWALSANQELDPDKFTEQLLRLSQAGFTADAAEVSERMGLKLTASPPSAPTAMPGAPVAASVPSVASVSSVPSPAAEQGPKGPKGPKVDPAAPAAAKPAALTDQEWSDLLDVRPAWLAPIRGQLTALETAAADPGVTTEQLVALITQTAAKLPESAIDPAPLAAELEQLMRGSAAQAAAASLTKAAV